MSGVPLVACAAVAICLGVPVIAAAQHLEARHRAGAVADAAALAAADAVGGWNDLDPCDAAAAVAASMRAQILECSVNALAVDARITASVGAPMVSARATAHAAGMPARSAGTAAPVDAHGWAWPSEVRRVSQGFHDGFAIDLASSDGGALFAPFAGVVVAVGPDGGGIPPVCQLQASWWHGPNTTVVIRHELPGAIVFSSHNHVAPDSPSRLGITVGTPVVAGQQVASSGMSGCTSGPHTHFTLATHPGNAHPDLDPFEYIGPP
ncbi:M23 family metallopeptidase [Leucobacter rhizosphaerae]|uniref:M23 family metallopeptidase n=1 Tax=Leucobacter rhizosphaerae TaxID=2932245 RepID=A0ABY4FZX3_9MICO|nr:M23 family metallopeptidase [Leucobacter rhizosphaerae]UOQ61689.1 M23 family metallopeptidase [Leucobacter rhizosphaerae]